MPLFQKYWREARYCAAVAASGFSTKPATWRTADARAPWVCAVVVGVDSSDAALM